MFHHRSKLLLGLLAALAIASITWQTVRYQQRAALRAAALKTDLYHVEMESMLPPWIARAAGSIDAKLPRSWRLSLDDWTLFQRTKSVSVTVTKTTPRVAHLTAFDDAEEVVFYAERHLAEVYPQLAGFWRLKSLWMWDKQMTPQDCRSLCDIRSEFKLTLPFQGVSPGNMEVLRNARGLTSLALDAENGGSFDCMTLRGFNHLRRLEFVTFPAVDQLTVTHVSELKNLNLSELDLGLYEVTDSDIQSLARLPLEVFHLNADNLSVAGHRSLAKMKNLKSLHLHGSLNVSLVDALSQLQLQTLHSSDFLVSSEVIFPLRKLSTVTSLHIARTRLSDAELDALADLPLRELEFRGCRSDGQKLAGFSRMRGLERLTIHGVRSRPEVIRALQGHPRLNYLNLDNTSVRTIDMEPLASCPNLRTIRVNSADSDLQTRFRKLRPDITVITSTPVYQ